MKYPFVVHIEDSECNLRGPVNDLGLLQFFTPLVFFLFDNELVEIAACAEFHDDIELLAFDDGFAIRYDVDMLEGLEEFDLNEDVFSLFGGFVGQFDLLDDVVFVLLDLASQVGVAESSKCIQVYPCPMIFKILYCSIIIVIISV